MATYMDTEATWDVIEAERRGIADLLASLHPEEWELPSLCAGWRIRDVAAHLALSAHPPSMWFMLMSGLRARGSFHRLNHDAAVFHAYRPVGELVAELRQYAGSRKLPVFTNYRNTLFDVLVHGQDIAIPLGRPQEMPREAARAAVARVWTMGWPFWARRRLHGFRLTATDIEWSAGDEDAAEVNGPVSAILLLLTGREAALSQLTGDGLDRLTARLGASG